jgi:hypothetical protein
LYDHGRKAEAMEVAKQAAEVYSHGGLETLAKLYERTKNIRGAEEYYKKIVERYDHPLDLNAFYQRNARSNAQYAKFASVYLQKNIPGGALQLDDQTKRQTPPRAGLLITESLWEGKLLGLKAGEILTALNGYSTRNVDEYNFVKELTHLDNRLKLTVWNGKAYRQVDALTINGMLGLTFENYPKPAVKAVNK